MSEDLVQQNSNNDYDIMKIYFGDPIEIDKNIIINQPTIGQIIEFGETEFWSIASRLCGNPTSMRLPLWRAGIDWNKISEYDLFLLLYKTFVKEKTSIFFGDLDFTKLVPIKNGETYILIDPDKPELQIDETIYQKIVGYLRIIVNIHPKTEKTKSKATKEAIIYEEEMAIKNDARKHKNDKWRQSILFPLISSALNHSGFKYKKNELRDVGLFEFMDSIRRLQIIESVTSLMTGMYMGMMDTSKLDLNKELNWSRDMYES